MNREQREAFHYEITNWNNIPIGSQNCRIGCVFCKVNGDPALKRYPPIPAITLEDLFDGYKYLDPHYRFVRLGAGVLVAPHTDPYLHPDIYTFIHHTAEYFPEKTVTTVTTGSYIDLSRLDFLWQIKNFGIDLSLVTMQPIRENIIPLSTRNKLQEILHHAPVRKISLMFTGCLDDLKRDIDQLLSLNMQIKCAQILVRRIEHTRFAPKKLFNISSASIAHYEEAVTFLKEQYPQIESTVPFLTPIYRNSQKEYFIEADVRIEKLIAIVTDKVDTYFIVVTPESSFEYFQEKLKNYLNVTLQRIPNQTYGGSVTVAGLLTNQDIFSVLDKIDTRGKIVILPCEIYDSNSCDLLGSSLEEIKQRYSVKAITL